VIPNFEANHGSPMTQRNIVVQRIFIQELASLYEQSRWTIYGWWMVMGTAGGAFAGFMFSPLLESPWWLLPVYIAVVYAFKKATMKLAEWFFAQEFWWQATNGFFTTFLFACLACVVWLGTSSVWISLPLIILVSFLIGLTHNLYRAVFVRNQFAWWYSAPLFAPLATVAGWLLLQTQTLDPANPAATAIAGGVIGFLYFFLTTILLRLMWDVSAAHSKLGTIYVDKHEEFQEALALHRGAIVLEPNNPKLYAARADTYHKQGGIDRARADIEHALALDPQCAEARVLRAVFMAEAGDVDRAIAEYDQVLSYKRFFYPAFLNRARAYSQKADYERALEDYAHAARFGPDAALSLAYRADTRYKMGNYDDAIADCDRVIATKTMTCVAYPMVLITRGKCYLAKGEEELGFNDLWSGIQRTGLPVLVNEAEAALRTLNSEALQEYVAKFEDE
jgi:tetratricopeptide (TPR) repeat protein